MRLLLGATPWRRAPVLLRRHPAVIAAVAGSTLVLGAAAAVGPTFLSSAGSAGFNKQVSERCQFATAPAVQAGVGGVGDPSSLIDRRTAWVTRAARAAGHLTGPVLTLGMQLSLATASTGSHGDVQLLYRDSGLDHIQKVADAGGAGVWITDNFAGLVKLHPGDTFTLARADVPPAQVRVRGIYRDMEYLPPASFWCSEQALISPISIFSETIPPPLILADRSTYLSVSQALGQPASSASWEFSLDGHLNVDEATQLNKRLTAFSQTVFGPASPFPPAGEFGPQVAIPTVLPFVTARSQALRGAVRSGIAPVSAAGLLVSLLLVAAAGSYWVERRRTEVTMLAARGVGPLAIGAKAVLEMILPAVAGAAAGGAGAIALVRAAGPSRLVSHGAVVTGLEQATLAAFGGLLFLGAVAAVRVRSVTEHSAGVGARWLRWVPFELAVLAAAAVAEARLRASRPALSASATKIPAVNAFLLVFPLLFLTGLVLLGLRVAAFALRRLRGTGWSWPHGLFLALRRLSAAPSAPLVLLAATALSVGVLVYSATLTGSLRATLDAKVKVFVGSDVAVTVEGDHPIPPSLHGRATLVHRVLDAQEGGRNIDVLGVDPSSFAGAAFWDASFADRSLPSLLTEIRWPAGASPDTSGPIPVVVANGTLPPDTVVAIRVQAQTVMVPVVVVARATTFPGEHHGDVLIVADSSALAPFHLASEHEIWVRGNSTTGLSLLRQAGLPGSFVVDAGRVLDASDFLISSWTFGYLRSLGTLTGLITAGGMLLYLESRQRSRKVAYALARRMGLSRRAHGTSIAAELMAALAPGFLMGAGLSTVAAILIHRHLDSAPLNPPSPLLRYPLATIAVAAAAVVVAGGLGTWTAQRSADRTNVAEELRVAE